jgi:hypothetical protein
VLARKSAALDRYYRDLGRHPGDILTEAVLPGLTR